MDFSVQYGVDQPEYDLIVSKGDMMLEVSVKGSSDGSWGLLKISVKKAEVTEQLKATAKGREDIVLYEERIYNAACGWCTTAKISDSWKFTPERVIAL